MDFTLCDLCGSPMAPHEHYVVRIDVFADPEMPEVTEAQLAAATNGELHRLIEKMRHMSAEELQDQVHRRVEFRICLACHGPFLANPLGKPRVIRPTAN